MIAQETLDKMHQHEIESDYSNGWYPVGVLEWTDDIPNYAECSTTGDDWLWIKQEDRDCYEPASAGSPMGTPGTKIEGKVSKLYWWSVGGSPLYGNTTYSLKPMGVVEILQYLVCSPVVAIGRPTERGTPVMGIPRGVRLKGMKEWILREDPNTTPDVTTQLLD